MMTYRKTAVMVGILFIVGTVTGILSGIVTVPISTGATFPLNIAASESQWILGTLLILLMVLSLAMVPVLLYPILKAHSEVLAFGAVLFRGVFEPIGEILLVFSFFLLLTLSEASGKAGPADTASFQTLVSLLVAAGNWLQLVMGIVFSVGTLMIMYVLYQTRLVPRWLSGWGLVGAVLYLVAKIVSIFSPLHLSPDVGSGIGWLLIPTAIQEMVFAVWMIVKGFNCSVFAAGVAKPIQSKAISVS